MSAERRTNPNPPLYRHLLKRLQENGGVLLLNSEEALAYWITVLQRHAAECEFGTNSDPVAEAPRLTVGGRRKVFTDVDLLRDNPRHLLEENWSPIELRA